MPSGASDSQQLATDIGSMRAQNRMLLELLDSSDAECAYLRAKTDTVRTALQAKIDDLQEQLFMENLKDADRRVRTALLLESINVVDLRGALEHLFYDVFLYCIDHLDMLGVTIGPGDTAVTLMSPKLLAAYLRDSFLGKATMACIHICLRNENSELLAAFQGETIDEVLVGHELIRCHQILSGRAAGPGPGAGAMPTTEADGPSTLSAAQCRLVQCLFSAHGHPSKFHDALEQMRSDVDDSKPTSM